MFSMPPPKIREAGRGILDVGVWLADRFSVIEADHLRGLAHEAAGGRLVDAPGDVIVDAGDRRPYRGRPESLPTAREIR